MLREERDLCQLPTSFLSRMPSLFLNNQWRFCHVWHNPGNRFEFERERERLLNWTVVVDPITSLWGKPKRRIVRQIFRSLRAFRPAKHTYLEWNLLGFMELLVLSRFGLFFLRRKRFVDWCLASVGWSDFPADRDISRRSKNERFAVARRETR